MQSHLNIHGLRIRLRADHPLIYQSLLSDLISFRSGHPNGHRAVRLNITALPSSPGASGKGYPPRFASYRDTRMQTRISDTFVTRYMTTGIAVMTNPRKREIEAAVIPDPALLPDPAYHYLFTQPLNLWFKKEGLFFLHAGCVAQGSRGVLFIGHSRAGKSALSVSSVRAGFQFLSDEQPLLELRGGRVYARCFPRRIRLDRQVAARFPGLKPAEVSGDRVLFTAESLRPGCRRSACRPSLLIFPRFRKSGGMRLRAMEPAAALSRLMEDDHFVWYRGGLLDWISQRHLTLFEKLVKQAPAYALDYTNRDIPRVPSLLRKLLGKSR